MKRLPHSYGFSSHVLHAGEPDNDVCRSHVNPIYQTSTFGFADVEQGRQIIAGREKGYIYSRWGNPTVEVLEEKVAALETMELRRRRGYNGEETAAAMAFSSGMAAISSLLLTLTRTGDTIITHGSLYGGSTQLIEGLLPEMGIHHVLAPMDSPEQLALAIAQAERARLVYMETPTNPTLDMWDIAMVSEVAHTHGLQVAVDNTFATPLLQQPLALGADFVVHSTTKYINGHGTAVGGLVIATDIDFIRTKLWRHMELLGGSPSPFDAWLTNQGLKTLALRMERQCANALTIARWLEKQPRVAYVIYPGLERNRYHELAKRQMKAFGGMISFELEGDFEAGVTVMNEVKLCSLAVSLGTVDTLIQHPASMTHASVPPEEKAQFGITDGLVRLSVGIEDVEDIIDDLDRAMGKIKG